MLSYSAVGVFLALCSGEEVGGTYQDLFSMQGSLSVLGSSTSLISIGPGVQRQGVRQQMRLHRVKTRLVNSYVIEERGKLAVVDVSPGGAREVAGYLEKILHRDLNDIELIVCTHDDLDHIGGVYRLARACDARVGIPWASRNITRKFFNDPSGIVYRPMTMVREIFHPRMWSMYANPRRNRRVRSNHRADLPVTSDGEPRAKEPDFFLKHKQALPIFDNWVAIHTPGHSWDSCCYYHGASKTLLTGDALLGSGTQGKVVLPGIKSNPRQYARTFRHLRQLEIEHIYPGHGSSIHGSRLLDHLAGGNAQEAEQESNPEKAGSPN